MNKKHAIFLIAFKLLLRKDNKVLFLRLAEEKFLNVLDLPGGRADEGEEEIPFLEILEREVKEEIGEDVKYNLGKLAFQNYRRVQKPYALINVYEGEYLSGDIKLSPEHISYEWIDPQTYKFRKEEFFNEEEYLAFKEYLQFKLNRF